MKQVRRADFWAFARGRRRQRPGNPRRHGGTGFLAARQRHGVAARVQERLDQPHRVRARAHARQVEPVHDQVQAAFGPVARGDARVPGCGTPKTVAELRAQFVRTRHDRNASRARGHDRARLRATFGTSGASGAFIGEPSRGQCARALLRPAFRSRLEVVAGLLRPYVQKMRVGICNLGGSTACTLRSRRPREQLEIALPRIHERAFERLLERVHVHQLETACAAPAAVAPLARLRLVAARQQHEAHLLRLGRVRVVQPHGVELLGNAFHGPDTAGAQQFARERHVTRRVHAHAAPRVLRHQRQRRGQSGRRTRHLEPRERRPQPYVQPGPFAQPAARHVARGLERAHELAVHLSRPAHANRIALARPCAHADRQWLAHAGAVALAQEQRPHAVPGEAFFFIERFEQRRQRFARPLREPGAARQLAELPPPVARRTRERRTVRPRARRDLRPAQPEPIEHAIVGQPAERGGAESVFERDARIAPTSRVRVLGAGRVREQLAQRVAERSREPRHGLLAERLVRGSILALAVCAQIGERRLEQVEQAHRLREPARAGREDLTRHHGEPRQHDVAPPGERLEQVPAARPAVPLRRQQVVARGIHAGLVRPGSRRPAARARAFP
ncbi:MAG: hypothetical protein U0704_12955 [Candidatus Eisenbacteria bacterium]